MNARGHFTRCKSDDAMRDFATGSLAAEPNALQDLGFPEPVPFAEVGKRQTFAAENGKNIIWLSKTINTQPKQ